MVNLMECLAKQKKILESMGYTVAYICIYGSQNYSLDIYTEEYQSDVDMKAIVVPTLDDLVKNSKPVSEVIDTEWGQCDVKDIRKYFETLLKANPAYVETLFTDYYIIDDKFQKEFKQVLEMREELIDTLKGQFVRAIYGMMCEKEKALCHPYPTIAHKIEKYGYDGKQAHHIHRLLLMMSDYFHNKKPLSGCFHPDKALIPLLMDLKLNKHPLDIAKKMVEDMMWVARKFRDDALSSIDEKRIDYSIKDKFLELSQTIIKNKIVLEHGGVVE